jgi:hypothetical protein
MMERPAESAYYVSQRLEEALCWLDSGNVGMKKMVADIITERVKSAIDLLRWYDWEEEQRRRQRLKGS